MKKVMEGNYPGISATRGVGRMLRGLKRLSTRGRTREEAMKAHSHIQVPLLRWHQDLESTAEYKAARGLWVRISRKGKAIRYEGRDAQDG